MSATTLLPLTTVTQNWEADAWTNTVRTSYSYDASFELTDLTREAWADSVWLSEDRWLYTYEESLLSSVEQQGWDATELAWQLLYYEAYTYSDEGLLTEVVLSERNIDSWRPRDRTRYVYLPDGRVSETVTEAYDFVDDDWYPTHRVLTSYPSAATTETIVQSRARTDSVWTNTSQETYTRISDTASERSFSLWREGAWALVSLRENEYDANGLRIGFSFELCSDGTCDPYLRGQWARNEAGLVYTGIIERWDGAAWSPTTRIVDTYVTSSPVGVEEIGSPASFSAQIYPNPARHEAVIDLPAAASLNTHVEIYDLTGRRVALLEAGTTPIRWQTDGLPAGTYLLRVVREDSTTTQTITVVR